MKLNTIIAENFGSFEKFNFTLEDNGLSLIYGPTGSGKSTIQDMVCWALFGITAKNGTVDEIRNWVNKDTLTAVSLSFCIGENQLTVTRIRGKQSDNDLYWTENDTQNRGKDITETQKLIEHRIGITSELYISGAYFSEFSPTRNFFVSKSNEKRQVLEEVANVSFAIESAEIFKTNKKSVEKLLTDSINKSNLVDEKSNWLLSTIETTRESAEQWEVSNKEAIAATSARIHNFEQEKEDKVKKLETKQEIFEINRTKNINILSNKVEQLEKLLMGEDVECPTCGSPQLSKERAKLENCLNKLENLLKEENMYTFHVEEAKKIKNTYKEQLVAIKLATNPYRKQLEDNILALKQNKLLLKKQKVITADLEKKVLGLKQLYQLSFELRGEVLRKATGAIQKNTNEYIEKYFDGALRIELGIQDSDNVKSVIKKNGYECSYKQLSKGQRCILNLCFSVAFMRVAANNNSVHFDTLFFDEALDGLDTELKVKAFSLFQKLSIEHNSIFIIDHSEDFKALFDNTYEVSMVSDASSIERKQ